MSNLLSQASLVMIPSGYKEDVVYSAVPTNGNGDLSFTRASNGTRVNSAGLVEVCPWNLVTYSSVLSDASYNSGEVTISYSQTDPNGGNTGALFTGVSATNAFIIKPFTTIIGQVYTWFVYLKGNSSGSVSIRAEGAASAPVNNVNYTTSYQQFTYTFTADSTSTNLIIGGFGSWTGSEAIYVAFPQANIGSTAKPYFPTTDRLNVPRLTYQNGGGGCPSLLLEKQSTNLANYSQDFGNAYWSKGGATITANATTSPDGTQDADKIAENTTSTTTHYINKGFTLSATTYTLSVFAKASERKWIFLIATTSADVGAFFDLENGVVGNVSSGYSASIENFGNGWYRCNLTFTATAATWYINYLTATANNTYNYAGTIGSGLFIWGAQVEASSYPTSYIPTTSSSATRVADACSKTGISSLIGQTEGTIFLDAYFDDLDTVNFSISDGTSGNYVLIDSSSGAVVFALVQQGGATQATINTSASFYTVGARLKCAIAYKANDFAFYINGNLIGTDNSGTVPACDQIRFARWNGVNPATQRVNEVITFPTRLTNAELAQLTA